jgi:hypothetical protein
MHPDITADQIALAAVVVSAVIRSLRRRGWLGPRFDSAPVRTLSSLVSSSALIWSFHALMGWPIHPGDLAWETARQALYQWAGIRTLGSEPRGAS